MWHSTCLHVKHVSKSGFIMLIYVRVVLPMFGWHELVRATIQLKGGKWLTEHACKIVCVICPDLRSWYYFLFILFILFYLPHNDYKKYLKR